MLPDLQGLPSQCTFLREPRSSYLRGSRCLFGGEKAEAIIKDYLIKVTAAVKWEADAFMCREKKTKIVLSFRPH